MIHVGANVLIYTLRKDMPTEMERAGGAGALTQGSCTTGGRVERR